MYKNRGIVSCKLRVCLMLSSIYTAKVKYGDDYAYFTLTNVKKHKKHLKNVIFYEQ